MNTQCSQCKADIQTNALFCSNCGVKFIEPIQRFTVKNKNNSTTAIVALISVLFVCGLCGIIGGIQDNNKKQSSSIEVEKTDSIKESSTPVFNPPPETAPSIASLKSTPEEVQKSSGNDRQAIVITENANIRTSPDIDSEIISTIPKGDEIEVIKQSGAWFLVAYNGQKGWMHGNTIEYLNRAESSPSNPSTTTREKQVYESKTTQTPVQVPSRPGGATAKCRDGTYSYSGSRRGTCSHHGGVAVWY